MRRLSLREVLLVSVLLASSASPPVLAEIPSSGWSVLPSPGLSVNLQPETAQRLRADIHASERPSSTILRHPLDMKLASHFVFGFQMKVEGAVREMEVRLVDPSGLNRWRATVPLASTPDWRTVSLDSRLFSFEVGPQAGGPPAALGAVEFRVETSLGAQAQVWIENPRFSPAERVLPLGEVLDAERAPLRPVALRASSVEQTKEGPVPALWRGEGRVFVAPGTALDDGWRSAPTPTRQWLELDLGERRHFGGLTLEWESGRQARRYSVQASDDGRQWETLLDVSQGLGGYEPLYLPASRGRYLRLELLQPAGKAGYALAGLRVEPSEFTLSPNRFLESLARRHPRGSYPRYMQREQEFWTVIGRDGGRHEALLSEDGRLEMDKGGATLEPFLYVDGQLLGWADVDISQSLDGGGLPLPSVRWCAGTLGLVISPIAGEGAEEGEEWLWVRYRLENRGEHRREARLFLALRPLQVNPPWQTLTVRGGASRILSLRSLGQGGLRINDELNVHPLTAPLGMAFWPRDPGRLIDDVLAFGELPSGAPATHLQDETGFASAVMAWDVVLEPGAHRDIVLAVPYPRVGRSPPVPAAAREAPSAFYDAQLRRQRTAWRQRLERVDIVLPDRVRSLIDTLHSSLAYILVHRDGVVLHPGARAYAKPWIRDGALTSVALLQMGYPQEVRDYLRWYARFQGEDGWIPCCIDVHGPDRTPEHDAPGQFIHAIVEYLRFTDDRAFAREMWPAVQKTLHYLQGLRAQRLTPEYASENKRAYYGLLPESASHEGYLTHPVHAYWDDFFALRGLKDAVWLAQYLGEEDARRELLEKRDDFRRDLLASIEATMRLHGISHLPASVELGDFDPSAIAAYVSVANEQDFLPKQALRQTFDDYMRVLRGRLDGSTRWAGYAPYEWRVADALVRLGRREDAWEVYDFLMPGRRPLAWNGWPEVVWRDPRRGDYIGDMPHGWIAADFIRATRSLLVYERENDEALILGAGLPLSLIEAPGGVRATRLPTWYGTLDIRLYRSARNEISVEIDSDRPAPPGGIHLALPLQRVSWLNLSQGAAYGRGDEFRPGLPVVRELPVRLKLRYEP